MICDDPPTAVAQGDVCDCRRRVATIRAHGTWLCRPCMDERSGVRLVHDAGDPHCRCDRCDAERARDRALGVGG